MTQNTNTKKTKDTMKHKETIQSKTQNTKYKKQLKINYKPQKATKHKTNHKIQHNTMHYTTQYIAKCKNKYKQQIFPVLVNFIVWQKMW